MACILWYLSLWPIIRSSSWIVLWERSGKAEDTSILLLVESIAFPHYKAHGKFPFSIEYIAAQATTTDGIHGVILYHAPKYIGWLESGNNMVF